MSNTQDMDNGLDTNNDNPNSTSDNQRSQPRFFRISYLYPLPDRPANSTNQENENENPLDRSDQPATEPLNESNSDVENHQTELTSENSNSSTESSDENQRARLRNTFVVVVSYDVPYDMSMEGVDFDQILNQLFQQATSRGPPPTSKKALDELPQIIISQEHVDSGSQCVICQEDFQVGQEALQIPCRHIFHTDCIVPWLKEHNTCPTCRYELEPEESDTKSPFQMFGQQTPNQNSEEHSEVE